MGVRLETDKISLTKSLKITDNEGKMMGELRSACYSPHFKEVIGIAMINEPYCNSSAKGKLKIDGNSIYNFFLQFWRISSYQFQL